MRNITLGVFSFYFKKFNLAVAKRWFLLEHVWLGKTPLKKTNYKNYYIHDIHTYQMDNLFFEVGKKVKLCKYKR